MNLGPQDSTAKYRLPQLPHSFLAFYIVRTS